LKSLKVRSRAVPVGTLKVRNEVTDLKYLCKKKNGANIHTIGRIGKVVTSRYYFSEKGRAECN